MDPLLSVINLIRPQGLTSSQLIGSGKWAARYVKMTSVKFGIVLSGNCWITPGVNGKPVYLETGDAWIFSNIGEFRLGSDLKTKAISSDVLYANESKLIEIGQPSVEFNTTKLFGGSFLFDEENAAVVLNSLPKFTYLKHSDDPSYESIFQLIKIDAENELLGKSVALELLMRLLFIQAMRKMTSSGDSVNTGWLKGLSDDVIRVAIQKIHSEYIHNWSVEELAQICGISRSGFSAKFRELVGVSPMAYLHNWRMTIAKDKLRHTSQTISEICFEVGYESEASFSAAFKKDFGFSPRAYRNSIKVS